MRRGNDDPLAALVRAARDEGAVELPDVDQVLGYLRGDLDEAATEDLRARLAKSAALRSYFVSIGEEIDGLSSTSTRSAYDAADVEADVGRMRSAEKPRHRVERSSWGRRLAELFTLPRTLAFGTGLAALAVALLVLPERMEDDSFRSPFVPTQAIQVRGLPESTFRSGDSVPTLPLDLAVDVEVVDLTLALPIDAAAPTAANVVATVGDTELFRRDVPVEIAEDGSVTVSFSVRVAALGAGPLDLRITAVDRVFVARLGLVR